MKVLNLTPFPRMRFYNTDNRRQEFGIAFVKATYTIGADGELTIADEQAPMVLTDKYHGAPNTSSLWIPSDLVPKKPRADIILNAVARAPGGRPRASWFCGVRIEGAHVLEKRLRVTGPRYWEPTWAWGTARNARETMSAAELRHIFRGWHLTEAEPVAEVPIRYEYAFGGLQRVARQDPAEPLLQQADHHNPVGRGWIDKALTPIDEPRAAPQIEDADEPIADPYRLYKPAGFGPIPPAWLPRRPLGGTFDATWREQVWPYWPADYDFGFHNSANADLIYPGFLRGDEVVWLEGFCSDPPDRVVRLPGHTLTMAVENAEEDEPVMVNMALDTLFLDVADPDPDEHRAFLTWRATFDHMRAKTLAFGLGDIDGHYAILPRHDRASTG